jgi:hypothetical protein
MFGNYAMTAYIIAPVLRAYGTRSGRPRLLPPPRNTQRQQETQRTSKTGKENKKETQKTIRESKKQRGNKNPLQQQNQQKPPSGSLLLLLFCVYIGTNSTALLSKSREVFAFFFFILGLFAQHCNTTQINLQSPLFRDALD